MTARVGKSAGEAPDQGASTGPIDQQGSPDLLDLAHLAGPPAPLSWASAARLRHIERRLRVLAPVVPPAAIELVPPTAAPPSTDHAETAQQSPRTWRTRAARAICGISVSVLTCGLVLAVKGSWDPQPFLVAVGSPIAWAGLAGALLGLALLPAEDCAAGASVASESGAASGGQPQRAAPRSRELAHSSRTL